MRTVALEEHFAAPALSARIAKDIISRRGYRPRNLAPGAPNPLELLPEIGEVRLKSMDDTGITVQVLSNSGPGPGPEYIRPELTSGGNSPKSSTRNLRQQAKIACAPSTATWKRRRAALSSTAQQSAGPGG